MRLAQSHIAEAVEEKRSGLQFLAGLTATWADRMVLIVFAGIAEFERSLIASRTEEGRRVALACGIAFGHPPKLRPDQRIIAR